MKWSVVTKGRAYYPPMVILYRITDHYNVYTVQEAMTTWPQTPIIIMYRYR